jgi:hypothetical protein
MDGFIPLVDYCEANPLRPIDWRWKRAEALRAEQRVFGQFENDRWVVRAREFQRGLDQATTEEAYARLAGSDPGVALAHRIWAQGEHPVRWHLEARLLTEESLTKIASRCQLDEGTVEAYEALFFGVRDEFFKTDSLLFRVIGPSLYRGLHPRDIGSLWKLLAYRGGPLVLDYLVSLGTTKEKPEQSDEVGSFLAALARDQTALWALYATLTLPVNERTSLELLRMMFGTDAPRHGRRGGQRSAEVDYRQNLQAMGEYLDMMKNLPPAWPVSVPLPGDAPALAPAKVEPVPVPSDAAGADVSALKRVAV